MDVLTAPAPLISFGSSLTKGATSSIPDLLRAEEAVPSVGSIETGQGSTGGASVAPAFGEILNGFLHQVDATQHRADAMVESLALGEPVDVHQVMLSLNEASDALHLTLQVRSKILDAYQELMRLPM